MEAGSVRVSAKTRTAGQGDRGLSSHSLAKSLLAEVLLGGTQTTQMNVFVRVGGPG